MGHRQIVIEVPEQVLPAEKTGEASFAREICRLRNAAAIFIQPLGSVVPHLVYP